LSQTDPLLFDTQAVISWAIDATTQSVISRVLAGAPVYVSVVSYWEFLLKTRYHDIGITFEEMQTATRRLGASLLGIHLPHLEVLRLLPIVGTHRDPFDRLIIAQAISEGYVLVGRDREFPKYRKTAIGKDLAVIWE
jgi:PIN domain nuclease of toxin-antitoxin system